MFDTVADSRLAIMWRHWLQKNCSHNEKIRGLKLCGSKVYHAMGWQPSVCIVNKVSLNTGELQAQFWGNAHCHSPWSCPYCSPRVMAKKGEDIAAAIDALNVQKQSAVMITFTMPHVGSMKCAETFSIIHDAWHRFTKSGNGRTYTKTHTKKDGEVATYTFDSKLIYGQMRKALGIIHSVKVWEFTWSERNSWHPHIHALFWIPDKNFNKIVDYEESLNDLWHKSVVAAAKNFYQNDEIVAALFPDWKFTVHNCVTISKDKNGKPRKQNSSNYLSGWSGDRELTGSEKLKMKTARYEGHYTPAQLMQRAYDEPQNRDELLTLYLEYAEATRGKRRVEFSKHGKPSIGAIIREWKKSNAYIERIKKKYTDAAVATEVVCWFTESQWQQICYLERFHGYTIQAELLHLALKVNGRKLIEDFLRSNYQIDISNNPDRQITLFENILIDIPA